MSNHASVYTRKHLSGDKLDAFFAKLNREVFHNVLVITRTEWTKGPSWALCAPGPIQVDNEVYHNDYTTRQCWLNTKRHFEISHGGGGGDFAFWIDVVVEHRLAEEFDGTIIDEGDGVRRKPNSKKYPTFQSWCELSSSHRDRGEQGEIMRRFVIQNMMEYCPPQFRWDVGKKIRAEGNWPEFTLIEED